MKPWIKILSLIPILAVEGIVIFLDIPELNLIAGGLLLITILIAYTFIAELWNQEKGVRTTRKKAVPGGITAADKRTAAKKPLPEPGKKRRFPFTSAPKKAPEGDVPLREPGKKRRFPFTSARKKTPEGDVPLPEPGKKRRFPFTSAPKKAPEGDVPLPEPGKKRRFPFTSAPKKAPEGDIPLPEPGKESRFPTFSAMMQGLKSLRQGFRTLKKKEQSGGDTSGESTLQERGGPGKAGISLASVGADATAPVPLKQEPSPFSPLIKDSGLQTDLIPSREGMEVSDDLDDAGFDEDFADIEIPAPETAMRADASLEDESPLAFDEDIDEDRPSFPKGFLEKSGAPGEGGEVSLEEEFESLDHLDLDTVGLEPGKVTPDSGQADEEKEQVLAKKMIDSDVREEYMGPFSSESEKDADLLSSLKSDMQGSRKRVNSSLIRDMRDIKIHVHDIEEELISFLQAE